MRLLQPSDPLQRPVPSKLRSGAKPRGGDVSGPRKCKTETGRHRRASAASVIGLGVVVVVVGRTVDGTVVVVGCEPRADYRWNTPRGATRAR
jgi:hypothetical protein